MSFWNGTQQARARAGRKEKGRERKKERSKREIVRECKSGRDDYLRQEPGRIGKRKIERSEIEIV